MLPLLIWDLVSCSTSQGIPCKNFFYPLDKVMFTAYNMMLSFILLTFHFLDLFFSFQVLLIFNSICSSRSFCISICHFSSCLPKSTFWLITSISCWFVRISSPFVLDSSIHASFFSLIATFLASIASLKWSWTPIFCLSKSLSNVVICPSASFKLTSHVES